jgi:hypothetical protein
MRLGTSYTAIVVGSNLGLLMMFDVVAHLTRPDHRIPPATAPIPARLAGRRSCYQLTFSRRWEWARLPERIELTDSVARFWERGVWRNVIGRPEETSTLIARWATAGPDSISLLLVGDIPGVIMRLSSTADTLAGRAWVVTDSWDPFPGPDAKVRAAPISCAEFTRAARRARSERS